MSSAGTTVEQAGTSPSRFFMAAVLCLCLLPGCTGLSSSNVGTPTGQAIRDLEAKIKLLHVGTPADSMQILFREAREAGEAGILHRTRVVMNDLDQTTYILGWKSDPLHQIGHRNLEDIDEEIAHVIVEDERVIKIELYD